MDGAGKSYLINHLIHKFSSTQFEAIVNDKGPEQDFNSWWPEMLDREKSHVVPIHDRFFYSELVYGPILRGSIEASPTVIQNVTWFLRSTALLIYARPSVDTIRSQILSRPQMNGVHQHFQELLELYDKLMMEERNWYGSRFIHYVGGNGTELERIDYLVGAYLGATN
jgi:thymidylate kinase